MQYLSFAAELTAFHARTADPGYHALILLGTRQATTAALLIGTLDVQHIAFLLTDDTRNLPDDVAALLGVSPGAWLCPAGDHSTTLDVYRGLRRVLDAWLDVERSRIAVDVTGGLKPMSVGVEKAAHVLGLKTIYIQSDYGKLPDGRYGPIAGTQRLEIPPDPYAVFGDLEAAEARRLYAAHDYAGAQRAFAALGERVPPPGGPRYAALAELAAVYAAWEVFAFDEARAHLETLLTQAPGATAELAAHRRTLEQQHAALTRLGAVSGAVVRRDDEARQTLADAAAMLPLLGTLHANALRRATQGRYDFAALFRYRCLELISQHRLASYGLLANAPRFDVLGERKREVSDRFQQQQREVGRSAVRGLGKLRVVGLFDGYMLLAALEDPLVRDYPIKRIEERSNARNHSVLAHGYRLIGHIDYDRFAEVVDELIDRLFVEVLHQPREEWERTFRFIDPFASS
jgi:CRISPR-associated protein (TIGR02710 family)